MIKNASLLLVMFLLQITIGCSPFRQATSISTCNEPMDGTATFSKAAELKNIIDELTRNGVPGCALTVYSHEGWWEYASGNAKIEDNTPMQTCNLQYLQSISKTYMAVAILKLH